MDPDLARRRRAVLRSKTKKLREKNPGIVAVSDGCDHVWGADGCCLRCKRQVAKVESRPA